MSNKQFPMGLATSPISDRADSIREDLCMRRVQVDCERDKYNTCCRNTEGSIIDLKSFLQTNLDQDVISSHKQTELERLKTRFDTDAHALLEQTHRTRAAESQVKNCEAQLVGLGIWVVGLPNSARL